MAQWYGSLLSFLWYILLRNSVTRKNTGNSRNGYGRKTIKSEPGETEIRVLRDRNGEFEPHLIEKRQTRTEDAIVEEANEQCTDQSAAHDADIWFN